MNHQLAINTRATERYLLGELDDESRSAFEEHYFSCGACADDVRATAQFVDNAKAVMASGERMSTATATAPSRWFPRALPQGLVPATMAACLALGYYAPRVAMRPASIGGFVAKVAVPAGTRGTQARGQIIRLEKNASVFQLQLNVADDVDAPRLSWRVKNAGGVELQFQTVRESQVVLPLSAADFSSGHYELILSPASAAAEVIDRFPFTIEQQ